MTISSDEFISNVLWRSNSDPRPLVLAVDWVGELIFEKRHIIEDLNLTRGIYPHVAVEMNISISAATRRVERLARLLWNTLESQNLLTGVIGSYNFSKTPRPGSILVIMAVYTYLGMPLDEILKKYGVEFYRNPWKTLHPEEKQAETEGGGEDKSERAGTNL